MKIKEILKCFLRQFDAENTVDYICGTEALPLPLSPEQESEMLGKLEHGEETDKVKAELIQHNLRLVVYIARKFDNTGVDPDDLISVGTIGLIKAINSFKLDKNIKLATYASRCIENEILMYLRRTVRLKSEVSFDEPLNTDFEGNELLLSDILGTSAESVYGDLESSAEKELLKEALRKLSERERKIMFLRFGLNGGEEMTQKDVADLLGISQSYISRLEKRLFSASARRSPRWYKGVRFSLRSVCCGLFPPPVRRFIACKICPAATSGDNLNGSRRKGAFLFSKNQKSVFD